jgi:hypothetical protein
MLRRTFLGAAGALALARTQPRPQLAAGEPVFLLGEEILEDQWNVERRISPPQRISPEPLIRKDRPWEGMGPYLYGSVLRDPSDNLWKCWYTVHNNEVYRARKPFPYRIAYAHSEDGLQWTKPALGLVEHGGNSENNLVSIGIRDAEAIDVCLAPEDSGAPARYLGLTLDGGIRLYLSDDGLRWKPHAVHVVEPKHSDCHNSLCWDRRHRRWLVHLRPPVFAGPGHSKRRIAVMESPDLKTWTRPETVVIPDEQDPPEFYSMPVFQRGNLFFGFLQIYDRKRESLEIELTYSADAYRWHRLPGRPVYLGTGPEGSFDSGMVTTADDIVIDGDRMLVYYGGWNGNHKSNSRTAAISCVQSGRDRLIGWHSSGTSEGYLLTKPCVLDASKAFVNASAAGLHISVCDEEGTPLPGFSFDDCRTMTGDALRYAVQWKRELASLRGRTVRFRVRIGNGAFYAFEFT